VLYPSCFSGCCRCGGRSGGGGGAVSLPLSCCCLLTLRWRRQCKCWWHWHTWRLGGAVLYPSCFSGCCYCGGRSGGGGGAVALPPWMMLLMLTQLWRRQCKCWWHWHTDGWGSALLYPSCFLGCCRCGGRSGGGGSASAGGAGTPGGWEARCCAPPAPRAAPAVVDAAAAGVVLLHSLLARPGGHPEGCKVGCQTVVRFTGSSPPAWPVALPPTGRVALAGRYPPVAAMVDELADIGPVVAPATEVVPASDWRGTVTLPSELSSGLPVGGRGSPTVASAWGVFHGAPGRVPGVDQETLKGGAGRRAWCSARRAMDWRLRGRRGRRRGANGGHAVGGPVGAGGIRSRLERLGAGRAGRWAGGVPRADHGRAWASPARSATATATHSPVSAFGCLVVPGSVVLCILCGFARYGTLTLRHIRKLSGRDRSSCIALRGG
jgi:hypothetical protein